MYVTGHRQSFQPFRIRYRRSLPVFDNLFSLIGLDTNMPYQSSTIFLVLPDSIRTTLIGLRQSFKSYRTRYRQTLPVLDNLFSLIGLDTNKRMNASMNASMNAVPGEREKCSVRCSRVWRRRDALLRIVLTFSKYSKRKEKCYHIVTQAFKLDRSSTFSSRTQDR